MRAAQSHPVSYTVREPRQQLGTDNFSVVEDVCVINVDGLFIIHNRKVTVKIQLFLFKSDQSFSHEAYSFSLYFIIKIQRNFNLYNGICVRVTVIL